eukprot:6181911-Pleurochrysis_carterae.AAC.2
MRLPPWKHLMKLLTECDVIVIPQFIAARPGAAPTATASAEVHSHSRGDATPVPAVLPCVLTDRKAGGQKPPQHSEEEGERKRE